MSTKLGIIAGKGTLPVKLAEEAARKGKSPVVVALDTERTADFFESAPQTTFGIPVTKAGKILSTLRDQGVHELVFAGKVEKSLLFQNLLSWDITAMKLINRLRTRTDDGVMLEVIRFLEEEGFQVQKQTDFLSFCLVGNGLIAGRSPTQEERDDISFGFQMAKGIAALDIGQTVVVKKGAVIAVEAIDGTDSTINRAGAFLKGGGAVVKVSKPNQDLRFDIPTVGLRTLKTMKENGIELLVTEAGQTFCPELSDVAEFASQNGMCVWGVSA